MKGIQISNDDMMDNMKEFVNQCVVYDALIGTKYTLHASDIMQLKPLNCYAKIANVDCVFKHEFTYLNLPIVANDFEAREMEAISDVELDGNQKPALVHEKNDVKILDASTVHQGEKNKTVNPIFEYKLTDSLGSSN